MVEFANNSVETMDILEPDDALPSMIPDTAEQLISRKIHESQVKTALSSLNWSSVGFQISKEIEIPVVVAGKKIMATTTIKAIPADVLEEISKEYQDIATSIPKVYNKEAGGYIHDESSKGFHEATIKMLDAIRKLNYRKILESWCVTLRDESDNVVWDNEDRDGRRTVKEGMAALKALRLPQSTINYMVEQIDSISSDAMSEDDSEFAKK